MSYVYIIPYIYIMIQRYSNTYSDYGTPAILLGP